MVHARLPERPKGADCKSAGIAFRSSNLLPGTTYEPRAKYRAGFVACGGICVWGWLIGLALAFNPFLFTNRGLIACK